MYKYSVNSDLYMTRIILHITTEYSVDVSIEKERVHGNYMPENLDLSVTNIFI